MEIYYTALVIIIVFMFLTDFVQKLDAKLVINRKTISLKYCFPLAVMILLTIASSLRSASVGSDTGLYIKRFEILGRTSWSSMFQVSDLFSFEYGFSAFCKLVYSVTHDYRGYLIITSIWVGALYYILIIKYSSYPMLGVLVFYCWGMWGASMNITREMMIVPILFFATQIAKNREFFKFALVIVCASLIHEASLIFLLIYPFAHSKVKAKHLVITVVIAGFFALGGFSLLGQALKHTSFGWYFDKGKSASGMSTLILLSVLMFLAFYLRDKLIKIDENIDIWILCLMAGVLSASVGIHVAIFSRVTFIFETVFLFVLPDLVLYFRKRGFGSAPLVIMVGFLVFYYLFFEMRDPVSSSHIIPYVAWTA